jgi:hypothetical protein
MARTVTADESRAEYVEAMGEPLGSLFYLLWSETVWLHQTWSQHEILFGTSHARVKILNAAAGSFFHLLQQVLWRDVLLYLCRLTDSAEIGRRENATITVLPRLISDDAVQRRVSTLITKALEKSEFARDRRNRQIAHVDLNLAMKRTANPLAAATRRDVTVAIGAVGAVLNEVSLHYRDQTLLFDPVGPATDALALLYVLRDGVELEMARQKRVRAGRPFPEDLAPQRKI